MDNELDGRLLALRQTVALALALSTRGNAQATDLALDILSDLRANLDNTPADSPFETPAWAVGAHDELDQITRLVQAFTGQNTDDSAA
ncbi:MULTISPECIES: hypothetical protein [unclassified Bordetella]|uniref:hypothetical protein n=1 Tax=unclassified Bordetella TaxID=2630031 RepID=UPI0013270541|nr:MULTISPECIES: hypothetical protein [unclassified Bordetella]MVW73069.1 hypothetical protein [Bordetella sp. 15P40C-2]MVW80278.1 hypothetical protein [Bordetella sp. 02P26C-1]